MPWERDRSPQPLANRDPKDKTKGGGSVPTSIARYYWKGAQVLIALDIHGHGLQGIYLVRDNSKSSAAALVRQGLLDLTPVLQVCLVAGAVVWDLSRKGAARGKNLASFRALALWWGLLLLLECLACRLGTTRWRQWNRDEPAAALCSTLFCGSGA